MTSDGSEDSESHPAGSVREIGQQSACHYSFPPTDADIKTVVTIARPTWRRAPFIRGEASLVDRPVCFLKRLIGCGGRTLRMVSR